MTETLETAPVEAPPAGPLRLEVPRLLGCVDGDGPGPTLICLAGLHGNEPAGVVAARQVVELLARDERRLSGRLVAVAGNRKALAAGRRFLDADLNRMFTGEKISRVRAAGDPAGAEEGELRELDELLTELVEGAADRVFLLDLHTTSGPGSAFGILDDTLPNREIALDLPVPLVLGLEEELSGTLSGYMSSRGVTVVGFEAGQHEDRRSIDRAEAAIWLVLASCGLLEGGEWPEVAAARRRLQADNETATRIVEVRYRHHIEPQDDFRMAPGFSSFQPVAAGQPIGLARSGPVTSPMRGLLLMPLYQAQGEDGFFLVRPVRPVWLSVSAALRRLRADRLLPWMPGVRRHPEREDVFVVDTRYARWLVRQLFHLLGYRRVGKLARTVVMRRRRDLP